MCLCTLKEEAVATSKSRIKGSTKEVTKDKDKKSRESQRSKRRTSAKTKAKGSDRSRSPPLYVSSMSDCIKQDQHQASLELKRNQRQEKHTDNTLTYTIIIWVLCCCCCFTNCACLSVYFMQPDDISLGCSSQWQSGYEDMVLLRDSREVWTDLQLWATWDPETLPAAL